MIEHESGDVVHRAPPSSFGGSGNRIQCDGSSSSGIASTSRQVSPSKKHGHTGSSQPLPYPSTVSSASGNSSAVFFQASVIDSFVLLKVLSPAKNQSLTPL